MSRVIELFQASIVRPTPICKFLVRLGWSQVPDLLVSSASIPHEVYQESVIWIEGRPVSLPTKKQVPGEWKCVFEDGTIPFIDSVKKHFGYDKGSVLQSLGGNEVTPKFDNITIIMFDSSSMPIRQCTLKHAWLKSVEPVSIDQSKAGETLKWNLTFRYAEVNTNTL